MDITRESSSARMGGKAWVRRHHETLKEGFPKPSLRQLLTYAQAPSDNGGSQYMPPMQPMNYRRPLVRNVCMNMCYDWNYFLEICHNNQ